MNTATPIVILSAERAEYDPEINTGRTEWLERQLESLGLKATPVQGSYKGRTERSFVVEVPEGEGSYHFDYLLRLARRYGQESVLHVDANGRATLHYIKASGEPAETTALGQYREVAPEVAVSREAWARTPDGRFYSVEAA